MPLSQQQQREMNYMKSRGMETKVIENSNLYKKATGSTAKAVLF